MEPYPLTIISDRYNGVYSGGKYLAFNLDPENVPIGPRDGDFECEDFWFKEKFNQIGIGDTPEAAIENLKTKL